MENVEGQPSRAEKLLRRVPGGEAIITQNSPQQMIPAVISTTPAPFVDKSVPVTPEFDINPQVVQLDTLEAKEVVPEKKDLIPKEYLPEDPTDEMDQLIDPKETIGNNFHKLRTKLKAVNKEKKQHYQELEEARKKLSDYENGLAVPELTSQQLARIEELEKYEKLYNFKGSSVYQERFAKPIQDAQEELKQLAVEYDVDTSELNAVFSIPDEAEANRKLRQVFQDDVGTLEAKKLLKNIRRIQSEAVEAEKEPVKSIARMQEENDRIVQERRAREHGVIAHTSKEAWSESLLHLRADPRFPEITFREGDTEHNEKYVRPILTRAGQEYGKIIRTLAEHGLEQLPKELSTAIARMSQLAHLSAVTAVQRDSLLKKVEELEAVIEKRNINRQSVNNNSGGNINSSATGAVGVQNAGRRVLERVMGNM